MKGKKMNNEEKNLIEKSEPDAESDNDSKNLVDPAVAEIVENVIKLKGASKKQRFHMYRMFNIPIITCAKLAGYKESYGYQLVREYRNDPIAREKVSRILSDMPEAYRSICKMRLASIAEIEGLALQKYHEDPQRAIDKPQLLKQVKQAGGIDLNEVGLQGQPTINIGVLENLQVIMGGAIQKRLEGVDE